MFGLFLGDLHCGSNYGLAPRKRIVSKSQGWLAECWQDLNQWARKQEYCLFLGADMIDGPGHHGTTTTWGNHHEQREGAEELLQNLMTHSLVAYGLTGTAAHVGEAGDDDVAVYRELGIPPDHTFGRKRLTAPDGKILDWSHHGINIGRLPWTESNGLIAAAKRERILAALQHRSPASVIISHHIHYAPEPEKHGGIWAAICPCWQLSTPYGIEKMPRYETTIGALIWEIESNVVTLKTYTEPEDKFTIQTIRRNPGSQSGNQFRLNQTHRGRKRATTK